MTRIVQASKSFRHVDATEIPDGVNVIVFHTKVRCPTCTAVLQHVRKTLELQFSDEMENGKIRLAVLDYQSPANQTIADRFGVLETL
ncbi:MAG: nitrophenyl compound nitroreductase subunit ArsF family protein [Phycisphaerales bacterium]|nr:nitrophenyl compound nitroreductase subunit ArsF family protein [Phycisphaerales bacterium]